MFTLTLLLDRETIENYCLIRRNQAFSLAALYRLGIKVVRLYAAKEYISKDPLTISYASIIKLR